MTSIINRLNCTHRSCVIAIQGFSDGMLSIAEKEKKKKIIEGTAIYKKKVNSLRVHVTCNGLTGRPVENYTGNACAIMLPFSFRVIRMNI